MVAGDNDPPDETMKTRTDKVLHAIQTLEERAEVTPRTDSFDPAITDDDIHCYYAWLRVQAGLDAVQQYSTPEWFERRQRLGLLK